MGYAAVVYGPYTKIPITVFVGKSPGGRGITYIFETYIPPLTAMADLSRKVLIASHVASRITDEELKRKIPELNKEMRARNERFGGAQFASDFVHYPVDNCRAENMLTELFEYLDNMGGRGSR